MSWKVAQNVMTSIISANRVGKLNIFACQKYSKKIQDKMNSQLLTRKEFKQYEDKKLWKSYVKFPGVLMVKKPGDRGIRFMMIIITYHSYCYQHEAATPT